jgi:pimeloyl-ACP methyl ester carboxylesterase
VFALHHQVVGAPGARGHAIFLHGLLGQGSNWRSTAAKLTARQPAWSAVLVDLRLHGRSLAAPPPHTVASAADDVEALARELAAAGTPVRALVGHSFGGKVALELRRRAPAGLVATAVFDASPSARAGDERVRRHGAVAAVLAALAAVPRRYARRDALVAALATHGVDDAVARWLAMSLVARDGGFELPFDLDAIGALLADYFARDLWDAVERPELPGALAFYVAGRSETLSPSDRARLAALAPRVTTRIFPDAEHWMMAERDALELPELASW